MCFAPQGRALFWHLDVQKWSEPVSFLPFWLGNVLRATTAHALFWHLNVQKWSEAVVSCAFSLRNVLCATAACTFSTSQLEKVLRTRQFWHFWLGNVLRATTACNFLTSQLLKVFRSWGVLYIFTSKWVSRHNGVQLSSLIWPAGSAPTT